MPLWWCLSLGACLGGNGTLIGASANLTVAGISERNGVPFRFLTYTLYAAPMTVVSIAICQRLCLVAIFLSSHQSCLDLPGRCRSFPPRIGGRGA